MNPVFAESGPLSLSCGLLLTHAEGDPTETRGTVAFKPELDAVEIASGWNVWADTPGNGADVTSIRAEVRPGVFWTFPGVYYAERTTGALGSLLGMDTTRYQVHPPEIPDA